MIGEVLWKLNDGRKKQRTNCIFFVIVAHLGNLMANTFPSMPLLDGTNCRAAGGWSPFVDEF